MIKTTLSMASVSAILTLAFLSPSHAAVDAEAAKALFKDNDCTKCHAPDKAKKGPSLKKIAEKYKGKADGQTKLITNFTTAPTVKLTDGTEQKHKEVNTKDTKQLQNLADWILSN
ncbi:c-type cytochrome [Rhodoferax sp.]|uniref:c-type cytochrome n=1 Tax=Rhodoferax sp. TaxID=50421 RepID=UPI002612E832|nr:c-type cytochrome [Rhodoferax sp.]MDD2926434.1 c-type cytochrome [Rhodoferax sp.]